MVLHNMLLKVIVDRKLSYWPHIAKTADKTAKMTTALSRLIANTKGTDGTEKGAIAHIDYAPSRSPDLGAGFP